MEDGGFAPNMMAGEGLPNMVGNVFPPITPTLLPRDVLPNITPTLLPSDGFPPITPTLLPLLPSDGFPPITPTLLPSDVLPNLTPALLPRDVLPTITPGQGLWDVCKKSCFIPHKAQDPERYSVWKRKNDMALHAIQISCSREMLSQIRDETRASEADRSHFLSVCGLIKALDGGNWNAIEDSLGQIPIYSCWTCQGCGEVGGQTEARRLGTKEDLLGYTPLALAASDGITEIAQCMLTKNRTLAGISDGDEMLPVKLAPGQGKNGASLLSNCIASQILDVALDILKKHPRLAISLDMERIIPIFVLGQMPSLFKSGSQLWFWQRWIYSCIPVKVDHASDQIQVNVADDTQHSRDVKNNTAKVLRHLYGPVSYLLQLLGIKNIYAKKLRHAQATELLQCICNEIQKVNVEGTLGLRLHHTVIQAVKQGNVDFATEMIKYTPQLPLHGLNNVKKMKMTSNVDRFGNNMLHLAAMLAPANQLDGISGAALQMQRELQWFKEVESIVPPICKDLVNADGKRPSELFTEQHDIAASSSFVAALIVTIMFAAAFTIPGGNDDTGAPVFLGNDLFMVFIISDSISLFCYYFSVDVLGNPDLTICRKQIPHAVAHKTDNWPFHPFLLYCNHDDSFLCCPCYFAEGRSTKVVIIPIILLACVPVTLFVLLQFPLLVEIFISTYGPGIFNRKIERWY
ncbi:hypothetical protein AAG906_025614 [Vitis piasezkii]